MNNPMNSAVRKIHNLLSSGAVTVTGPNQPRILKQKVGSTTVTSSNNNVAVQQNSYGGSRCYVCDDSIVSSSTQHQLTEMHTSHTNTKFPNKIGQLVGDAFMVIVSVEDVVCSRCTNLINYLDRLENDVERVRTNIINLLHKKYGLNDDGGGGGVQSTTQSGSGSPPLKMQKLTTNVAAVNRMANNSSDDVGERVRKTAVVQQDSSVAKSTTPVSSAVQQIKISTPQSQQTSQTIQRKTTKIYKCPSCDYKTSDMRLFNTHYETCKQQNFQCKNCKKIFPNFGAMKQHMIKDHNTPMDNTCAVCHINFVSDQALRKHMEINHSTNVVVTSSTTIPAAAAAEANSPHQPTTTSTPLYTCNHCQFKSTDKPMFDEHMRKHMTGNKPKPFKCRLCSQRFETREQATVHAKQHQPNYFKCGTCHMSFPKRELLVKHFEVHQQQSQPSPQATQKQQTSTVQQQIVTHAPTTTSNTMLTTQKLLQETIDEALSDTVPTTAADASGGSGGGANANIRFFSCHICSLTFIQENYYNQHMETHKREKKNNAVTTTATSSTLSNNSSSLGSMSSSGNMMSDGLVTTANTKSDSHLGMNTASSGTLQHSNSSGSGATISEADIESIFEKMHSDKGDGGNSETAVVTTNSTAGGDNLVITSQAGSGGITFNITIPQPDGGSSVGEQSSANTKTNNTPATNAPVSVSIDMPMLDQPDETPVSKQSSSDSKTSNNANGQNSKPTAGPVSMPSLDDDNDGQEHEQQSQQKDKNNEHTADETKQKGESESETEKAAAQQQSHDDNGSATNTQNDARDGDEQSDTANNAEDEAAAAEQMEAGDQQQVTMELDEAMQAQVEGGQIKFILNENGQLLQLDNHIITDADGNQILVQDPEQIQQLLQSVGVLQGGEGLDGETLQMMTDGNGQMVLVQGDNNETQLIDASLLNADGQLVIQQGQDGELGEGAHVIGEDGTRIPVSVSYTADGQPIVQVQQQVMETDEGQQLMLEKDGAQGSATSENSQGATSTGGGGGGGGFFALEDLMQQSAEAANAKDSE